MESVTVMRRSRSTPLFNIGVASRLTGVPIHTLRWIERQGLISPARTGGNQRLFSEKDVEMIQSIQKLLDRRVNVPGIRIILTDRAKAAAGARRSSKHP